nr:hypothetical protein [Tanacetum cinerariifolium]
PRVGFLWGKRWRVVGSSGNGREGAGIEEEGVVGLAGVADKQ